jgi:hypothetical protein
MWKWIPSNSSPSPEISGFCWIGSFKNPI